MAATPLNRYPDPMSNDLRDELASWHGVARENICVGNGGDELLYNYLLAFGGAGRTLLNCPPCFSEYAFFASLCQTEVRDVWRDPVTFELDQAAVLAVAPECNLAIVTSPNIPRAMWHRSTLSRPCAMRAPAWSWSTRPTLSLRTIRWRGHHGAGAYRRASQPGDSAYAVQGVWRRRHASGLCDRGARGHRCVAAIRQIYSVNVLSQAAALACVRARDAYAPVVAQVASERERELCALRAMAAEGLPVEAWPSAANFGSCARRMPRACASVCATSIRFGARL